MGEKKSFVNEMLDQYMEFKQRAPGKIDEQLAEKFSRMFVKYFDKLYQDDIKRGKTRKQPGLASAQTALSVFKKHVIQSGEKNLKFIDGLHLTLDEMNQVIKARQETVKKKGIDLPTLKADAIIEDCRDFLSKDNPYLQVMALACLTGRRMAEIILTVQFNPPKEKHYTDSIYWTSVTGLLKKRLNDGEVEKAIEIPLLAPRPQIIQALKQVRDKLPASSVEQVNAKYGKNVARTMKQYCKNVGNLHQFRKFYVMCCYKYFNERKCSLPRLASDYLGHKTLGNTVLTYLNFRVEDLGRLSFQIPKSQPPPPPPHFRRRAAGA